MFRAGDSIVLGADTVNDFWDYHIDADNNFKLFYDDDGSGAGSEVVAADFGSTDVLGLTDTLTIVYDTAAAA